MPSLFPIEECDMDRLYEIEQAAHLVPWSLGTLKIMLASVISI